MLQFLNGVDTWFLKLAVFVLGVYFMWSLRKILTDFKEEVKDLKETIVKLFDRGDDFERRLSNMEGRCEAIQCKGGRRGYDPPERPGYRKDKSYE